MRDQSTLQASRLAELDEVYLKLRKSLQSDNLDREAATTALLQLSSTAESMISADDTQQARCRLLELPAELRNTIYELAFTPDHPEDEDVDVLEAQPPSNALLLTCSRISSETREIYKDAYRKYWTTTPFRLVSPGGYSREMPPIQPRQMQCKYMSAFHGQIDAESNVQDSQYTMHKIVVMPRLATFDQIMRLKERDLEHITQITYVSFDTAKSPKWKQHIYHRWTFESGAWFCTAWFVDYADDEINYMRKNRSGCSFYQNHMYGSPRSYVARNAADDQTRQDVHDAIKKEMSQATK